MIRHQTDRGRIFEARAESVYPLLAPGSVQLAVLDGPYALKKAGWDMMSVEALPEWYRPHIGALGVVCAPDASTYVWGTDASASALRPEMKAHGWTLRVRITWDKVSVPAVVNHATAKKWVDVTEVCDLYTRGDPPFQAPPGVHSFNIWRFGAPNDLPKERLYTGGWQVDSVKSEYKCRKPLHPCQKPLVFSERIIRASSEPGMMVLEPFGGLCRVALAIESLSPAEARRYVCVEVNDDGVDYLGPAIEEIEAARGQAHLFGAAPGQEVEGGTDPEPVGQWQPSLFG